MNFASALLLLVSAGFPEGPASEAPVPKELRTIALHGDCRYQSASGTDTVAKVKDVVRRFNAAVICKDRVTAELFVDAEGTVEEVEEYAGEDGQPVRKVAIGTWPEQIFLFTRADGSATEGEREEIIQGEPSILIDGSSALVRQPLWTRAQGNPAISGCMVQHLMLVKLASDWKIRHMMLIDDPDSCQSAPEQR